MTTTNYSFTCPCCRRLQSSANHDKVIIYTRPRHSGTQDILFLCPECAMKSNTELGITRETPIISKMVAVTTLTCDCGGCKNSTTYTDEPIASDFAPGYFWVKAPVLPEHETSQPPGLRRVVKKDICPGCIAKVLAGTTT